MKRRLRAGALLGALAGLLHGCAGSFGTEAHVRLVNATRDHAALDLYDDSQRVVAATGSAYVDLDDATHTLTVRNTGSSSIAASIAAALEKDRYYSVVRLGVEAGEQHARAARM